MNSLRILHLLAPAPFGGLESVVQSLATEQLRAGFDVHVAAILDPDPAPHPFVAALAARGIQTHPLTIPQRSYREERKRVRQLVTNVRPEVVHTHGYRADVLHGWTARAMGIPWVSTVHGFIGGSWKNRVYEDLQRFSVSRSDAVVAVSRPIADQFRARGVPANRLHWIPNAWSQANGFLDRQQARQQLGLDADVFCAGFIGRLGFEKGPDTFIDAVALLRQPLNALLIGEGALRSALQARAVTIQPASVRFAGKVDGAGRLIKAFDVIVLSSRTEGTPIVLLEAMAARVPVIATRVGGIPDVVSEREAILTLPDQPSAIADAIRNTMSDPGAATDRATAAASRLAAELNAQLWLKRYLEVYRACERRRSTVPPVASGR